MPEDTGSGLGGQTAGVEGNEVKGDLTEMDKKHMQFEPCSHRLKDEEDQTPGYDKKCKYMDNKGNCIFENCRYDQEETPPHVTEWYFTCVICHEPDSIDPKRMKIHWCRNCIARANEAEVLPFTCRYCGKKQGHPSQWFLSMVCDSCIDQLYNPNCKNYWCSGCFC